MINLAPSPMVATAAQVPNDVKRNVSGIEGNAAPPFKEVLADVSRSPKARLNSDVEDSQARPDDHQTAETNDQQTPDPSTDATEHDKESESNVAQDPNDDASTSDEAAGDEANAAPVAVVSTHGVTTNQPGAGNAEGSERSGTNSTSQPLERAYPMQRSNGSQQQASPATQRTTANATTQANGGAQQQSAETQRVSETQGPRPDAAKIDIAEKRVNTRRSDGPRIAQRAETQSTAALQRVTHVEQVVHHENATGTRAVQIPGLIDGSPVDGKILNSNGRTATNVMTHTADQPVDVDGPRVAGRVVRGMQTLISQQGGTMQMRLDPPELGQLRVQMSIVRGVVTATFHTSSEAARSILDQHMGTLRGTLEQQGLSVDRLSVQGPATSSQSNHAQSEGDGASPNNHEQDASKGQSRGRQDHEDRPDDSLQEQHPEQSEFERAMQDFDQEQTGDAA